MIIWFMPVVVLVLEVKVITQTDNKDEESWRAGGNSNKVVLLHATDPRAEVQLRHWKE